ncbi:MAG TPA: hypothetical protein DFS52_14510, partial [Myxococcales bacterium]|nr:hypothetical protein [Myxococcales bacterium]
SPPVITAATSPQGVSSAGAGLDSLVGAPVDQGFILDHSSPAEALATLASQEQPAGDLGFVLDHSSPAEALSSLVDSPDGFGAVETPGEEPLQLELGADAAAAMTLGLAIDESVVVAANAPELELTEADAVPSFELTAEDMAPDSPEQAPAESDALRFGSVDPPSLGVESLFGTGPAIGEAGAVQRFSAVRIEPLGGEDVELDVSSIEQGFAGVSEELAPPRGAAAAEDAPPFGAAGTEGPGA